MLLLNSTIQKTFRQYWTQAVLFVGVNNRDLHTFVVDLQHTIRMRKEIPADRCVVGESGIFTYQDAMQLQQANVQAMLVGESLMRKQDVTTAVRELLNG